MTAFQMHTGAMKSFAVSSKMCLNNRVIITDSSYASCGLGLMSSVSRSYSSDANTGGDYWVEDVCILRQDHLGSYTNGGFR